MPTLIKQRTAAQCAQGLLGALHKGSDEGVQRAIDEIVNLSLTATRDSRELEFRELLAGIAEPIGRGIPEFLSSRNSSSKMISVEMLMHVAADGRLPGATC